MMDMKRVLVPVDFSHEAEIALAWAIRIVSEQKRSMIYLLHVITLPPVVRSPLALDCWSDVNTDRKWDEATEHLTEWRHRIPTELACKLVCREGDLVHEIGALCKEAQINLVVMTTHARRGLTRLVHPNATEKVVRAAPCPVLALHLHDSLPVERENFFRTAEPALLG